MKTKGMRPINLDTDVLNPMSFGEKESIETYLNDIREFKPLERNEEIDLVERYKRGDGNAFDEFVKHYLLLVVKTARKYSHLGLPMADVIQSGNEGLIKAARDYMEHEWYYLKNRFVTYAIWYIRKGMTDSLENEAETVRRTHNIWNTALKIRKESEKFERTHGYLPDTEDLIELTGEKRSDVEQAVRTTATMVSTDVPMDDSNEDYSDTVGDGIRGDMDSDELVKTGDRTAILNTLLSRLKPVEREMVKMSFGIGYDYEHSPEDISEKTGVSAKKVRAILEKSMKVMKSTATSTAI